MRKEFMKLGLVIVFSSSVVFTPHAALAAAPAQAGAPLTATGQTPLTGANIIAMVRGRVPEWAIIAAIRSGPVNFNLSPMGLAALRQAGVSEEIINAMEQRQQAMLPAVQRTLPAVQRTLAGAPTGGVARAPLRAGPVPGKPSGKLTPQQLSALLAKVHSGAGKLSPVVTNPAATQANAPILALLRQQKLTAMVQRSQSPPPAAHPAAPAFGRAYMARPAVRAAALPAPSSRSSITNNLAAMQGNIVASCAAFNTPIIQAVSGQSGSTAVFTQDPNFNPFTIKGCNFGNVKGQAQLNYSNGRKLTDLTVDTWTDNLITVEVPPSLTDVLDQASVTLVLFPASGPQVSRPGFRFYAMRRRVRLTSIPPYVVSFAPIIDDSGVPVQARYSSPYQGESGGVDRFNIVRFPGGTDVFHFAKLKPGFVLERFQVEMLSDAVCGSFGPTTTTWYTDGSWGWQMVGNTIRVTWQESHCHDAYAGDESDASYGLNVWVVGPALSPTGSPWR
jgi:hypothetical protein